MFLPSLQVCTAEPESRTCQEEFYAALFSMSRDHGKARCEHVSKKWYVTETLIVRVSIHPFGATNASNRPTEQGKNNTYLRDQGQFGFVPPNRSKQTRSLRAMRERARLKGNAMEHLRRSSRPRERGSGIIERAAKHSKGTGPCGKLIQRSLSN